MKKTSLIWSLSVVFLLLPLMVEAKRPNIPALRSGLTAGFSYEIANSNAQYFSYSLEYTRHISGMMHWGVTASYRQCMGVLAHYDSYGAGDPYINSLSMDIPTITGMFYGELPVVSRILALRGGVGLGVGYHVMTLEDAQLYKNRVIPYFTLKLQWIIRPVEWLQIDVSPLIIGPSTGAVGPWTFGPPSTKKILAYCNMAHIQVGVRF